MPNKSHEVVQNGTPVNASSNRSGVVQSNSIAALVSEKPSNGEGRENMEEERERACCRSGGYSLHYYHSVDFRICLSK